MYPKTNPSAILWVSRKRPVIFGCRTTKRSFPRLGPFTVVPGLRTIPLSGAWPARTWITLIWMLPKSRNYDNSNNEQYEITTTRLHLFDRIIVYGMCRKRSSRKEENRRDQYDGYCLLYTSPSPRDGLLSRMPSSA